MNPPNNHNSFYGDPNIDNMRSYHPFSPNYPENRRNSSPYHTSTPKHMYDSNLPLNLSCRSSDSSYDYPSPHSNHSPGFPGKFRLSRNHSYSFHNSSNFNDSASRRSFSPSFNYRNNKKRNSSPPFNVEDYCSPEMLEDPWAHLVSSSPSKSSSGPVE